jgi:predicted HTH transcriptional regulator
MKIDNDLIESFLNEEESIELDLKKEQYHFTNADDDEKSELLKDVLSFSNSWRRSDACILIGVEAVKGGRNIVVGINDLLDDAAIQQFINSKTNRPITFSYKSNWGRCL